jgi:hypothetical protein
MGTKGMQKYTDNLPALSLPSVSFRSLQGYLSVFVSVKTNVAAQMVDAHRVRGMLFLVAYERRGDKSRVRSKGHAGRCGYYMKGSKSLSELELIPVKTSELLLHSNAATCRATEQGVGADQRVQGA